MSSPTPTSTRAGLLSFTQLAQPLGELTLASHIWSDVRVRCAMRQVQLHV